MNENKPNEFFNTSVGIAYVDNIYQSGLSDKEKTYIITYLQNLIDIIKTDRVCNAELKLTNETTKIPENSVYYHIPTGIKIIELMIRYS